MGHEERRLIDASLAAARRTIARLEREKVALHEMFERLATADKRTPLAGLPAAMVDVGGISWIVPRELAEEIERLKDEATNGA